MNREEVLELAEAGLRHAEGLSAQLAKPDWKPSRSHVEQARNSIKKLAELLSAPAQQTPDAEIARLTPYVEAFRREEARADKLGQELDDLRAAQCAPNPILQKCDLGFNAGWNGAIEEASKIAENNGWEATAAQIRDLSAVEQP